MKQKLFNIGYMCVLMTIEKQRKEQRIRHKWCGKVEIKKEEKIMNNKDIYIWYKVKDIKKDNDKLDNVCM